MPRTAALKALIRSDRGAGPTTELLAPELDRRRGDPRDRDLARELAQGAWRLRGAIDAVLARLSRRPLDELDTAVLWSLRLGAYQLLALDRVPGRAAVHTTVEALKTTRARHAAGFVNAVLRKLAGLVRQPVDAAGAEALPARALARGDGLFAVVDLDVVPPAEADLAAHLAVRWSHPAWWVERLLEAHDRATVESVLAAGLARPALSLRPTSGPRDELAAVLRAGGHEVETEGPCVLVARAGRVTDLPGWDEQSFAVQGPTAAEVVPALGVGPGEGVLELCAAPGGKTLQLAEAVGPDGVVLAVDVSDERLERVRTAVARRGLAQVAVVAADAADPDSLPRGLAKRAEPGFDAVLVDVPCSNSGVFGRRVEARWRLEGPERVTMLAEQGAHLLMVAAGKVRVGGRVAFSTCSIDPEENDGVVRAFLAEDPDFELVTERLTLPVAARRDGGYHAILRRTK